LNPIGLIFTLAASAYLLTLPRRLAAIPFLIGTIYMTRGQVLEVGPAHFTVVRILVAVGVLRVLSKGERIVGGLNRIDVLMILWALFLIISSVFHTSDAWVFRAGMVWSELGSYFLLRIWIQDSDDIRRIFSALCIVLVPIAALMLLEKAIGKNLFGVLLGGIDEVPSLREGHYRAAGPFDHPILAGVVGATCLPMALYLWKSHRTRALEGLFAGGGIIFASTSSGPIMMLLFILFGLALWKMRKHLSMIRRLALAAVIALDVVMKDPVYFLMARIDLSGGSTGWYRARLIQSSIEHLDEWWAAGTDYTRHWMPTGISANAAHADITNHLLAMGVMGGIPLMFLFIMVLVAAFSIVGRTLRESESASMEYRFLVWLLGAVLFGHVWNFFSISLFDQSVIFFYLVLACIGAVQVAKPVEEVAAKQSIGRIRKSRYVARLG